MSYTLYKIERDYKNVYYFLKNNKFSENYIANLRKKLGYIKVNDEITTIKQPLHLGDKLEIESSPNSKTTIMHCILPLDIVYEDEYYLLVNKPSNLTCMPNKSHYSNNLAGAIVYYMSKKDENFVLRIINRLDKDTSGIIIVAKNSIAQKDIKSIEKTYYALCDGIIDKYQIVNKRIKTETFNGINLPRRIISDDGQDAETIITPIKVNKDKNISLVSLKLIHGRTHQIRVHLSSISHPLLGDSVYGKESDLISHTALYCKKISFYHPYLNKTLEFEVPYEEDFKKIVESL